MPDPLFDDLLDQIAADVLHSVQSKANLPVVRCKTAVGDVDVRRKHLDAKAGTLAGIFDDFIGVVQHAVRSAAINSLG